MQVRDDELKMWESKYLYLKELYDGRGGPNGHVVRDLGVKKDRMKKRN